MAVVKPPLILRAGPVEKEGSEAACSLWQFSITKAEPRASLWHSSAPVLVSLEDTWPLGAPPQLLHSNLGY